MLKMVRDSAFIGLVVVTIFLYYKITIIQSSVNKLKHQLLFLQISDEQNKNLHEEDKD